jgi:hypothetical protein
MSFEPGERFMMDPLLFFGIWSGEQPGRLCSWRCKGQKSRNSSARQTWKGLENAI